MYCIGDAVRKLANLLVTGTTEGLRDVYASSIRSLLHIPTSSESRTTLVQAVLPTITLALGSANNHSVTTIDLCLEVLGDLIHFSPTIIRKCDLKSLEENLFSTCLDSTCKVSTRKRSAGCIGSMLTVLTDARNNDLIGLVDSRLDDYLFFSCISSAIKSGSITRIKPYMQSIIVPRIQNTLSGYHELSDETRNDDLAESSISCLEAILCLKNSNGRKFLIHEGDVFVPIISNLIKFNPNYIDHLDDQDKADYSSDDEYYSDDEDSSWKIRKACVKLITSVVHNKDKSSVWLSPHDDVSSKYESVFSPLMLKRLAEENEESVRVEILNFYHLNPQLVDEYVVEILSSQNGYLRSKNGIIQKLVSDILCFRGAQIDMKEDQALLGSSTTIGVQELSISLQKLYSSEVVVSEKIKALNDITAAISHHQIDLIPTLLPFIIKLVKIEKSLIKEIDLGPFKHKVDSGAPLRKAAMITVDFIAKKLSRLTNQTGMDPQFLTDNLLQACELSLEIDLSNSGDEVYMFTISILNKIMELNSELVFAKIKV